MPETQPSPTPVAAAAAGGGLLGSTEGAAAAEGLYERNSAERVAKRRQPANRDGEGTRQSDGGVGTSLHDDRKSPISVPRRIGEGRPLLPRCDSSIGEQRNKSGHSSWSGNLYANVLTAGQAARDNKKIMAANRSSPAVGAA